MASLVKRPNRHYWVQFTDAARKRQTIRLGKCGRKAADICKTLTESLLACQKLGTHPDAETVRLLAKHGAIREKLAKFDLCEGPSDRITLGAWTKQYGESRTDWSDGSKRIYGDAVACLLTHFGGDRLLNTINDSDAENFRIWMRTQGNRRRPGEKLAEATVGRRIRQCRTLFKAAIKAKHVSHNPFTEVRSGHEVNTDRQHFVAQDVIDDVMSECNRDWQTLIALSRFGGLRSPSETLLLKWSDVNFDDGEIRISGKGSHGEPRIRICPIFEELRPYLERALAAKTSDFVVGQLGGRINRNLGTQLRRFVKRAGHQMWPRAFHNMRASRETELLARYPAKDVVSWLGNSEAVAMKHYAMATSDSFARAAGLNAKQDAKHKPKQRADAGDCTDTQSKFETRQFPRELRPQTAACVRRLLDPALLLGVLRKKRQQPSCVL